MEQERKAVNFEKPLPSVEKSLSYISWSMKDLIKEFQLFNENFDKMLVYVEQIAFKLDR